MTSYRFEVGTTVLCNLGELGWKQGRIIAHNYREDPWPEGMFAPYQVVLEDDRSLIYVPEDDDRYCREPTAQDLHILGRTDALAAPTFDASAFALPTGGGPDNLRCEGGLAAPFQSYRKGRCFCCDDCPRSWGYAELYSEHYRCATRNGLTITRHDVDLGTVQVGEEVAFLPDDALQVSAGFMQAPMLVRLPPGLTFSDEGGLGGEVRFDPYREDTYEVNFVAVSTEAWQNTDVGLVRLELRFTVEGNTPPEGFDRAGFAAQQESARAKAQGIMNRLRETWDRWSRGGTTNRATCDTMLADLDRLRSLAEQHPRLDQGQWWAHLGGYHMNVHKLLENTLFECELYLGYALTFGEDGVRYYAEQNLEGCYSKRLLEAARFMWYDGLECILQGEWAAAIDLFRAAADKKDGWGWAVNHGDIWLSEAVALMLQGTATPDVADERGWLETARELIQRAAQRTQEARVFDHEGHPWIREVQDALSAYEGLEASDDVTAWREALAGRTVFWCAQVLSGGYPFPPPCRDRLVDEQTLLDRLPGHPA